MKKLALACLSVVGCLTAFATNTWYVAKNDPNAADTIETGRGSEALPFRTIQAALDNAAFEAGDIVLVKPGDYDEGETKASGTYSASNRVMITKSVHLKAFDSTPVGRAKTRIIGKMGTTSKSVPDCGTDCVRCVRVAAEARGTVIEGFTLKDGNAYYSDAGGTFSSRECCLGGGIYVAGSSREVTVVDCVFENCIAAYGGTAMYYGTAIRCEMNGCKVRRLGLLTGTYAFACLVRNCTYKSSTATHIVGTDAVAVGCTFVNNNIYGIGATAGEAYNCIFEKNRSPNVEEGAATNDCYVSATLTNGFLAVGFSNYSLLPESPAIGVGKAKHRSVLIDKGVPAAYLERDLAGKVIDWTAMDLNAGAFPTTAVPATGRVTFDADTMVDGRLVKADEWICSETFPSQHELVPVDTTKTLFAYSRTAESSSLKNLRPYWAYPGTNGVTRIFLPHLDVRNPDQTYTPKFVAAEIWVDPSSAGSDETGDGTSEKPYQTLQKAVDEATAAYVLVRARRGDYCTGGREYGGLMTRVDMTAHSSKNAKPVKVVAEEGPAVTTIWGAADPDTRDDPNEPGCGPKAVRCVAMNSYYAVLQGFTLRDGHTLATSATEVSDAAKSGAAVYGVEEFWRMPPPVLDCVITNCVAANDIVHHAYTVRSRLVGNLSTGPIFDYGFQSADLVVNNRCAAIFGVTDSCSLRAFLLTCHGNEKSPGAEAFVTWTGGSDAVCGSIVVKGRISATAGADIGNVVWEQDSVSKLKATSVCADPILAAPAAGDYRPANASPAVDAFDPLKYKSCTEYLAGDLDGRPLRISADGKLTAGCLQQNLPTAVVVAGTDGALLVDGQAGSALTNVYEVGSRTLTISANEQGRRYAKGFTVNGVEHLFAAYPGSETITFPASEIGYRIEPILSTVWYANVTNAMATANGFTLATGKPTLAGLFTDCDVRAGDTVYVAPGTYEQGVMRVSASSQIGCRVVVPAGVTLEALGSAEETVIKGASSPEPVNGYGAGTNAVRCVALGANAVVRGFTLTGGRTMTGGTNAKGTAANEIGAGAGVWGVDCNTTALADQCIISNNVAGVGGGGSYAFYRGCRFYDNHACDANGNGTALYRTGNLYDCCFEDNPGAYVAMYPGRVYRCTFGSNGGTRSVHYYQPDDGTYFVFNSVIARPSNNCQYYWNCVVYTNSKLNVSAARLAAGQSVGVSSLAGLGLDANLRPLADSPVVDNGDDADRGPRFPETDLNGVPRILNGCFDIGAFEYDWRVDYGRILGRGVTVTEVTSNVVVGVDGKSVVVPEGSLAATCQTKGYPLTFKTAVTGEGTLTVTVDGTPYATVTAAMGEKSFLLPKSLAEKSLAFAYEGEGCAALSAFKRAVGLVIIVK